MSKTHIKKSKLKLVHQYYSYTGFYSFVLLSIKKSVLPISLFIISMLLIHRFIIDFNVLFSLIVETFPTSIIFTIFFASESILGLIPPEIFIAWAGKSSEPILFLSLLALLSYLGGVISYFAGISISKIPSVYNYLEVKMQRHLKNIRKWGGFLIIVGALLPIPFAMTSIAAGVINYKFRHYLLFGLLRFVRFFIFALAIFQMV